MCKQVYVVPLTSLNFVPLTHGRPDQRVTLRNGILVIRQHNPRSTT
jgi:hypothetical protein